MKKSEANQPLQSTLDGYDDDQLNYGDVAIVTDKDREDGMWATRNYHRWIFEEDMSKRWELYYQAAVQDGIMTEEDARERRLHWAKYPRLEKEALA